MSRRGPQPEAEGEGLQEEAPQPPESLQARPGMDLQDVVPQLGVGGMPPLGGRPIPVFGRSPSPGGGGRRGVIIDGRPPVGGRSEVGGGGRSGSGSGGLSLSTFWQLFTGPPAGMDELSSEQALELPARAQSLPAHARKEPLFKRAPDMAGHQPPPDLDEPFDFEILPFWHLLGIPCAEEPTSPSNASTDDVQMWRWSQAGGSSAESSPASPWLEDDFQQRLQSPGFGAEPGPRVLAAPGDEDVSPAYPKYKEVRFQERVSFEDGSAGPVRQRKKDGPILWHLLPGSH